MMMLRKIIDNCESLVIFQEKLCDGVSFSKVASLQCSDCIFAIKKTHHRFFSENVPQTSCLKKEEKKSFSLRKKLMVDQRLNKAVAL